MSLSYIGTTCGIIVCDLPYVSTCCFSWCDGEGGEKEGGWIGGGFLWTFFSVPTCSCKVVALGRAWSWRVAERHCAYMGGVIPRFHGASMIDERLFFILDYRLACYLLRCGPA